MSSLLIRFARPGNAAHVRARAEGHQELALLAQQLGDVLVLAVADRAVEERQVELAVGHRLDVLVLAVHGDGPEADVGDLGHVEDELVGVEHGDVAAAARGAPVERDLELLWSATAHLSS